MRFDLAIISGFLLAPTVLATRRDLSRRSQLLDLRDTDSTNYGYLAGVGYQTGANQLFTSATGIFTVPHVHGEKDSGVTILTAIDGATNCRDGGADLMIGIVCAVTDEHPTGSCYAMGGFFPGGVRRFDVDVSPGDEVRLTIEEYSTTTGYAVIENLTREQAQRQDFTTRHALCNGSVAFGISKMAGPFANWGTVKITNFQATGPAGTYVPSMLWKTDIKLDNKRLSKTTVGNDESVTIQYL